MINSNISLRNNQVILQRDLQAIYWLGGRLSGYNEPEVISDLPKFTDLKKNILKTMLMYLGVNHKVYVSQQTIAEKVGCHHDTVYEAIKLFVDLGILKKKYRGANKTCVYFMGSLLYLDQVKLCLKDILPNLWWSFNSMMKIAEESLHNTFITMAQKSYFAFNQNKFPARLSNDNNKDKNNTIEKLFNNIANCVDTVTENSKEPNKFINYSNEIQKVNPFGRMYTKKNRKTAISNSENVLYDNKDKIKAIKSSKSSVINKKIKHKL